MIPANAFLDTVTQEPVPPEVVLGIFYRLYGTIYTEMRLRVVNHLFEPVEVLPKPERYRGTDWDTSDLAPFCLPQSASWSRDMTRVVQQQVTFTMESPAYSDLYQKGEAPPYPYVPSKNLLALALQVGASQTPWTFEVPLGIYWTLMPSWVMDPSIRYFSYQLDDLTQQLEMSQFWSDYVVYANYGGGIAQAAIDMLHVGSIPFSMGGTGLTPINPLDKSGGLDDSGPSVPLNLISIDLQGNQIMPYDKLFTMGGARLSTGINVLLEIQNFLPLWLRNRPKAGSVAGEVLFCSAQKPDWGGDFPPLTFDYSTLDPTLSIVEGQVAVDMGGQYDTRAKNFVKVVGTPAASGTGSDFMAFAQNNDPNSIIALQNMTALDGGPLVLPLVESNSAVVNQDMADLRATLLANIGSELTQQVTVQTGLMCLTEPGDLVGCSIYDVDGNLLLAGDAESPLQEVATTLPLNSDEIVQQRTLRRSAAV